jgi:hypothetical protein
MSANADALKQLKGRKLPVSYGNHVIEGSAVLRIRTIPVGSESQVYILAALGDSTNPYGWQGPIRVTYDGGDIAAEDWRFHPGTRSTGMNDPVQGADDWFEGSIPYNGTPCIALRLPVGAAESIDDASKIVVICECQIVDDYDTHANITGHEISRSPARIVADYGVNRWGLPLSRFNWESWVHYKEWCAEAIAQSARRVPVTPDWTSQNHVIIGGDGGVTKNNATAAWDSSAITGQLANPADGDMYFEFVTGNVGTFIAGLTATSAGLISFVNFILGAQFNNNGIFSINVNGVNYAQTTWSVGETWRVGIRAGLGYIQKSGVTFPLPTEPVIAYPVYGAFAGFNNNASIASSKFVPGDVDSTVNIPRFETSVYFVDEDFQTVLDRICTLTCSEWQDYDLGDGNGMQIHMVTPEDRDTVHDFIDDEDGVNVPGTGNIVSGSLNVYPVDEKSLVNLITLTFKDTETDNYIDTTITCERPDLRDKYGDVELQIYLGPSTHHQAKRIGEFEIARKTDYPTRGDWKGMGDSDHLVPGDLVRLLSSRYGWVDGVKTFIITSKEEDDSGSADAVSYTFEERVNGIYRDDVTLPLPSIPEDTSTPNPYFPPPLITSLSLDVQQNRDTSIVTQTIIGLATFANWPRQHGRVWIKRLTAPAVPYQEVGTIVPDDSGQAAFPIPNVGDPIIDVNYMVRVISESLANTSLPFSAATEYPITVYAHRLPMPVNFAYQRISNDFVITWEPGTTDIIELVERYILRVYDNVTGTLIRTHEVRLNDSVPCIWTYFFGGGDVGLVSMDNNGSIFMAAHVGFDGLIYDSQPFYGDCDILFAVDNRHFINVGLVNWPRMDPIVPTGTYIERYAVNTQFADAEGATTGSFVKRVNPHSQFMMSVRNGQVEYYIDERFWMRSFQGPIQQTFIVSILIGYDILDPQALLNVRVRKYLPRQFVYTEAMQGKDFDVAGGGVITSHFRFQITQISSANVESEPAIIIT